MNPKLVTNSDRTVLLVLRVPALVSSPQEPESVKKLISLDPIQEVKKTLTLPWFVAFASDQSTMAPGEAKLQGVSECQYPSGRDTALRPVREGGILYSETCRTTQDIPSCEIITT